MYDASGRLLGKPRTTSASASVPGLWTMQQQIEAKRASIWPLNAGEDPYFANISLLLRGDGTNGSTTILDESFSPKTVTAYGNAQISTAQSKYGGSSIAFDGSGDYLSVPASTQFSLSTVDYTIEFWAYWSSTSGIQVIVECFTGGTGPGWTLYKNSSNRIDLYSGGAVFSGVTSLSGASWYYIAVCKSSTNYKLFINGVQDVSVTYASANDSSDVLEVGGRGTSFSFNGYIDDLRITKGVARYTSNFTPPGAL